MDFYLWIKALHIISVIAWMAALLYLPRLYVYHCDAEQGSKQSETFKVMERRLLRAIGNPAMLASIGFGIWLMILTGFDFSAGWMHVKLTCVAGLIWFHMALAKWRKGFESDQNQHSAKFYRFMNEVPTALMVIIVIMVVVKPF